MNRLTFNDTAAQKKNQLLDVKPKEQTISNYIENEKKQKHLKSTLCLLVRIFFFLPPPPPPPNRPTHLRI